MERNKVIGFGEPSPDPVEMADGFMVGGPLWHTGVFALKIISNNAILLVILISTTFAPLGSIRVSDGAKSYK